VVREAHSEQLRRSARALGGLGLWDIPIPVYAGANLRDLNEGSCGFAGFGTQPLPFRAARPFPSPSYLALAEQWGSDGGGGGGGGGGGCSASASASASANANANASASAIANANANANGSASGAKGSAKLGETEIRHQVQALISGLPLACLEQPSIISGVLGHGNHNSEKMQRRSLAVLSSRQVAGWR
jgi:hypothetical protein